MREPLLDDLREGALRVIRLLERLLELPPTQGEQLDFVRRTYRRRPPRLGEKPDLTKETPRTQCLELDLVAFRGPTADDDLPTLDDEEAVGGVALGDDRVAFAERHPLRLLCERVQLRTSEVGKHL